MMQRGRGGAFLWAREQPASEVAEVLMACMRQDPCWDPQVEDRTPLWIEVAGLAGLDPAPVVDVVEDIDGVRHPDASPFSAAGVLAGMAAAGDAPARAALLEIVSRGRNWPAAVWQLIEWGFGDDLERPLVERLERDAEARETLTTDPCSPAMWDLEPWTLWRDRHPVMARVADAEAPRAAFDHPAEAHAGMSVEELLGSPDVYGAAIVLAGLDAPRDVLRAAAADAEPLRAAVALRALAHLGDVSMLDRAAAIVRGPRTRGLTRAAQIYIEDSHGDAAVVAARRWVAGQDAPLARIGWSVLAHRATADDVPRLSAALAPALDAGDMYRLCNALDGLQNVSEHGPFPGVERVFREAPYAFARRHAAAVLAATDPAFPAGLAIECLWDSDDEIRAIGAGAADRSMPGVAERVASMPRSRG